MPGRRGSRRARQAHTSSRFRSARDRVAGRGDQFSRNPLADPALGRRCGSTAIAPTEPFRHALAERVEAEIRYDDDGFRMRIRDDGKGIDPVVLAGQGIDGHYGLRGMPERAALMGGELVVWSELGEGTEVELRVPASAIYPASLRRAWWSRLFAAKTPL